MGGYYLRKYGSWAAEKINTHLILGMLVKAWRRVSFPRLGRTLQLLNWTTRKLVWIMGQVMKRRIKMNTNVQDFPGFSMDCPGFSNNFVGWIMRQAMRRIMTNINSSAFSIFVCFFNLLELMQKGLSLRMFFTFAPSSIICANNYPELLNKNLSLACMLTLKEHTYESKAMNLQGFCKLRC